MNAVTSTTAAKMKALREAKKLGCSGAHQTSDGVWRPCSSAESLAKIVPSSPSSVGTSSAPRRQQRGNNNMQRQWENLGSRGIVAIDTLSGGGLVSGVVGKQYQPAAPRDEDPDVFTDIEAARDRSRQLGCIGVSRRISRSGRTIWMPCTNMTDLANRTGRTALGRRNMQKRTERFIADVVKRNQPKAMRSRKKSLYDDLHGSDSINTKGLGPKVGKRIGRGLRAAPSGFVFIDVTGAIDADKDGIVFEGLPLERPIIPRFIIPEGTARRVQNLVGTTALANEQNRRSGLSVDGAIDKNVLSQIIGVTPNDVPTRREDPLLSKLRDVLGPRKKQPTYTQNTVMEDGRIGFGDADLEISRGSERVGKREASTLMKALDAVDDEYEFLSAGELNDLVAQLVPSSDEELMQALKSSPYTRKNAKRIYERITAAEPDYEATLLARKIIQDELFRNPGVRNAVRRYGMPPIVVTGYEPDIDNMGFIDLTAGPRMWQSIIGGYAPTGFIAFNSGAFPDPATGRVRDSMFRGEDLDSLLRHELAHAWQFMAAKQGGPARDYLISLYSELHENLKQGRGNAASAKFSEALYRSVTWGSEQERASARRISDYAETARIEWFAESFAAFTDDDPGRRMRVDNTSIANMANVLGMSVNEFMTFVGETNKSQLSERARSFSTRSVSNLLLGPMSKQEKEAHDWLLNNPNYIADSPDAMLLRLPPDTVDTFIRNQRLSTRSRYNTDVSKAQAKADEARRNGELGQQVLDSLFARATGENSSSRPTMWFIGGTTGSGKSTLRTNGVLSGVPGTDTAVDIDPDVIKTMHPDWDNGRGASAVHGWSTQWALYGMRQATAQNRDYVVTGTGVRVDQMLIGRDNGYKVIGHYVHVPTPVAEKRMVERGKQGGVKLPTNLASQYAAELQYKVRKAITNGYMDEFNLWDNSQDDGSATLAAVRREDGTFEILNRKVFEEFFGKDGARAVEKHWESQRAELTTGSVLASTRSSSYNSGLSTRSSQNRNLPERLIIESPPNRKTTIYRKNLTGKRTSNSELSNIILGSDVDLSESEWINSNLFSVTADNLKTSQPIVFRNSVLKAVSFRNTVIPRGSDMQRSVLERVAFEGSEIAEVNFGETTMRGVDFSKANVSDINLRGAILERVEFDVADLSNSGLTPEQLRGSGMIWTDRTKFSPEIQQFIESLPDGQIVKQNGKYAFKVNAESTSLINKSDRLYAQARQALLGPRAIQIPTPSTEENVITGLDGTNGRISDSDWTALRGGKISKSYMERLFATNQNIVDVKINDSWMDGTRFTGSTLQDVSLVGSSLRRASFRGTKIRGTLDLKRTDLRQADFSGAKFDTDALRNSNIDLRSADLTNARLGSLPLGKMKLENATLSGAVWDGPTSMIPKDLRDRGLVGTRSLSRTTSYGAAIQMNDLNDRLANPTRLNRRDREELIQDMSSMYRELIDSRIERPERQEFADFLESLTESASNDLNRFRVTNMPNRSMLLIESARANDKNSFVDRFKQVREVEPDFMKGLSAIRAWREASSAARKYEDLDALHSQALEELREDREVAQSLPQLQNILHGDFLDGKNRQPATGRLQSGKREKTPIISSQQETPSTRSTRSSLFRAYKNRPMTEEEKQRFQPLNLADGEKTKIESGVKLIFANEYDEIQSTLIVGPQVARFRGTPGTKMYIDPNPPEQDFIDEKMAEWERAFGPPSDPRRRTSSNQSGGGGRRSSDSQRQSGNDDEDALDRINRLVDEDMARRGAQSTRSRTDAYLLTEQTIDELVENLELNERETEIAKSILAGSSIPRSWGDRYDAEQRNHRIYIKQKIDDLEPDSSIGETGKEIAESLSIRVSSNGIPVITSQPHPFFNSIIPDRRDWAYVEAPSADAVRKIIERAQEFERDWDPTINEEIDAVRNSLYKIVSDKLDEVGAGPEIIGTKKFHEFAPYLIDSLENPRRAIHNLQGTDGIHDAIGHLGTGRGFDRHGEWANALAMVSVITDHPDIGLDANARDRVARWWLDTYGTSQLMQQLRTDAGEDLRKLVFVNQSSTYTAIKKAMYDWPGTVQDLIDTLTTQSASSLRSTRSSRIANTPNGIFNLAYLEQDVRRAQFMGNVSPTMAGQSTGEMQRRQNPVTASNATRSIVSRRSTRSLTSTVPQLRISEDGSRAYMDTSAKDAFLANPQAFIDSLTEADIPDGYFPKGERNKLDKYKQDLLALATLDSLVPNEDGYGVSARHLFAIDALDDSKPNPPDIVRRDARRNILATKRTEKIFHQADVASLGIGEALFVTDIPASGKMSAIDNGLIVRNTDGSLTLIEIENEDELDAIEDFMDGANRRMNENGVGILMLDDIRASLEGSSKVSSIIQALENYHTTIADIDPRIPRPNIVFKSDYILSKFPGIDSKRVAGTAYPDANSIVMWKTSEESPYVDIMLHEFGHIADFALGYRATIGDKDVSYSPDYPFSSITDDWVPAMQSDQAHGLLFGAQNIPLSVLADRGKTKQPASVPGTTYRRIAPTTDESHGPRIGNRFITQYSKDSDSYQEDLAESVSLFLRDKMFGFTTSVTDSQGREKRYTFAEMYPNRAAVLERLFYPSTRSTSDKFDKRFKSSYGVDPIDGDGDCYEAASNMADRLKGPEFGFTDDQIRIVHGVPLGTGGEAMGIRYGHAWAEVAKGGWEKYEKLRNDIADVLSQAETLTSESLKSGLARRYNQLMQDLIKMEMEDMIVYDFSNGNEHTLPRYLYYKIGNIEDNNTRYYSRRDADIKMVADETYGPWE